MSFESIQELFCRTADRLPTHAAVERGDSVTTFQEIERRSNRLAAALLAGGGPPAAAAALVIDDAAHLAAAILACLKARCMFVPLDAATPDRRLAAILADVGPQWLLAESRHAGRLAQLGPAAAAAAVLSVDGEAGPQGGAAGQEGAGRLLLPPDPDDRSYVFFTSGSTGTPKGIVGRLRAIDHFVRWEIATFGLGDGTRVSQLTSPAFDAVLRDLFVPLCCGGTVCAPPSREVLLDPRRLADWIDGTRLEVLHCVPSLLRRLLNLDLGGASFPALRRVLVAGEPLLPVDVARWTRVFGDRIELVNLYGPSETTMTKLFYRVRPGDGELFAIPIGKPMPGATALAVDEQGHPCAPGQVGEVLIRTRFRAHGYWNRPDLTGQVFVPNPFGKDPADLVYRTGDLARVLDDGNFVFLGRADRQVKVHGVRIEPGEIEALLRRHEAVREVAVTVQQRAGEPVLCAYLVLDRPVEPGTWRELLSRDLPAAMIPSRFLVLEEMPRTLSGKIDLQALPWPEEGVTEAGEAASAGAAGAPVTPTEAVVAEIFAAVLGIERIGLHEDFFERGGHSLLAIQVLARIQQAWEVELPLGSLFEHPTVAGLAAVVAEQQGREPGRDLPLVRRGAAEAPLSFAQQRLWLVDLLEPGSAVYNLAGGIRMAGPLDVSALRRALAEVARRHEALRTVVAMRDEEPVQQVLPPAGVALPIVDLSAAAAATQERLAQSLAAAEAAAPFDLASGPLLRCRLLRLGADQHVLTCTMHHIVSDVLSQRILVRELALLYGAFSRGGPSPLPELPLQYGDFAFWQRRRLTDEALAPLLAHWRTRLAGAPSMTSLPTDYPRVPEAGNRGAREIFTLPDDLADGLRQLSAREDCTLFVVLLAGFQLLIGHASGHEDVLVGLPVAFRNEVELESMIGLLLNAMVVRTDLSGDPSFRELLARVRDRMFEDLTYQHLPFERLVAELRLERSASRNALFQITFNFIKEVRGEELPKTGLAFSTFEMPAGAAQFDLSCTMYEAAGEVGGSLLYRTGLFERGSIVRLVQRYQQLLAAAAAAPEQRLSALRRVFEDADRQQRQVLAGELEQAGRRKLSARRRPRRAEVPPPATRLEAVIAAPSDERSEP
jgi:amino acid adenylation domain-containing protein